MPGHKHIDNDEMERYVLQQTPPARAAEIDEHLVICPECQRAYHTVNETVRVFKQALNEQRFVEVHQTEDGPINIVVRFENNRWVGRITGGQLDGGFKVMTRDQALIRAREDFIAMFPSHRCDSSCLLANRVPLVNNERGT
jgi:hypothetical protein